MASATRPILRQSCLPSLGRRTAVLQYSSFSTLLLRSHTKPIFPSAAGEIQSESRKALRPRTAEFHESSRRSVLPPLPQVIKGTVNDAARVPDPAPAHGSFHWSFERVIAAALIPLTVAPFATGSLHPITDATLCALLIIHSHIGFESIIIDYVPQDRLPRARKLFMWALKGGTLLVAIGLYEFETNDVGLTEGIKRIWKA